MAYWIYKCNSKSAPHKVYCGDWNDVFLKRRAREWGSTEIVPALAQLAAKDIVIAYQSDRNELVGVTEVVRLAKRGKYLDLILRPTQRIGASVRPLKKADEKINAIPALKSGQIKTIYEISVADAKRLLKAARQAI